MYIYIYINNTKYNIYIYIIILNRAGPAQTIGPDSAPKVLGRFRPKMDWADLGPKNNILFWARPGPEDWAGPGPAWPSNKTGEGN